MRIAIDMQGAQSTGSRYRGIGRYTISLAKAIVRNRGKHEILLVLNGLFPESIESIRAAFEGLLPQQNIRVWYAVEPVSSLDGNNDWRRNSAELIREAFLASLKPDIVLVTSLFEGLGDDAVTSIGLLSNHVPTAVILYDLIPFIHRHPYLENPVVESWYENKLDHLRRGDLFLAISESSRQEGISYLGFPEDISVNVSTAADSQFKPQSISHEVEADIRKKYGLKNPYVMYTGGIDHRKNIEGLIRAYARLPKKVRIKHQLAVVCSIQPHDKARLVALAKEYKLESNELVLTGFIPEDDLIALYALCKVFVFPSWHEGFGLPALEAMSCGRAVIGSNRSSVPEVIGLDDALFDPKDDQSIADKLFKVLTDETFRSMLEQHGLKQAKKFSWDKSAIKVINTFESHHAKNQLVKITVPNRRPKLAFVSPLPPERSGISDYSAELLPVLSKHYDIDVIVDQNTVSDPWINANCQVRNVEWFRKHDNHYDRVLYQFGNSHFHQHMFSLLKDIPGVVVLHDFFLSGIVAHIDLSGLLPASWAGELYKSHGFKAVQERFHIADLATTTYKYPCNRSVLSDAKGVIVHSNNSLRLASKWFGSSDLDYLSVIPLLREPALNYDRAQARHTLNLKTDDFVICSFGMLNPTKLNHSLLNAWINSELSKDKNCQLVFVGENDAGEYGQKMLSTIKQSSLSRRIRITDWTNTETYNNYLTAADVGVQLRTHSRGETSAAVLDCMNYGIPTIVNANGSMADLEGDAVWKLTDEFSDEQLKDALEILRGDKDLRIKLGAQARETILNKHAPRTCANQYFETIERFYCKAAMDVNALTRAVSKIEPPPSDSRDCIPLATAIVKSMPARLSPRQLLVDISELANGNDQHVAKSILQGWLNNPPEDVRIEPVYAAAGQGYRYARHFTLGILDCPTDILSDEPVEYSPGDIFIGLACKLEVAVKNNGFYQLLRDHGVHVEFVIYDNNLSIDLIKQQQDWFDIVIECDGVICKTEETERAIKEWANKHPTKRLRSYRNYFQELRATKDNSDSDMMLNYLLNNQCDKKHESSQNNES